MTYLARLERMIELRDQAEARCTTLAAQNAQLLAALKVMTEAAYLWAERKGWHELWPLLNGGKAAIAAAEKEK